MVACSEQDTRANAYQDQCANPERAVENGGNVGIRTQTNSLQDYYAPDYITNPQEQIRGRGHQSLRCQRYPTALPGLPCAGVSPGQCGLTVENRTPIMTGSQPAAFPLKLQPNLDDDAKRGKSYTTDRIYQFLFVIALTTTRAQQPQKFP